MFGKPSRAVTLAGSILLALATAAAADYFRPEGDYDPSVPTPAELLGFELGERPAQHGEILLYAQALADASPLVELHTYAHTHEERPLIYLAIGSARNLARLADIRRDVAAIADPRPRLAEAALSALIAGTPGIAYLAYSIHGDEISGADAALRVAYELAAGRDEDIRGIRENMVVLIDPSENPDGRERILSMIRAYRGAVPNPDPDALNHEGFWPWGRANHYLFDLNRDWFALVHPESRGRAAILREWRPQLVVDAHEMGSGDTFLMSPPRDPFNPNWPSETMAWWNRFAVDQASAFDEHGWSYYTRDWNEEFFPGYGSALAVYQGAVGILYEQSRTAGQPVRKPSGQVLTYREAIAHQYTGSIANLRTAARSREELYRSYRGARAEAIERGGAGPLRAFYFTQSPDARRAEQLAETLTALGIEVERLSAPGSLKGARHFYEDGDASVALPAGSFRVRLDQPDGLLARAILEPHTPMPDSSLAREREYLERDKGSRIYDTTAWSMLLAYGVDCWWTGRIDNLDWRPYAGAPGWTGGVQSGEPGYGYLWDGGPDRAPVLAAKLAALDFVVRCAQEPFACGGRSYPRGSFLVRAEENPASLHDQMPALADGEGVAVYPVASASISLGPDLGGNTWRRLVAPRVAIASGAPLSFTSVGAAWHLLDREAGLRTSLINVAEISRLDLDRYNTIVLPGAWGGGAAYSGALGEGGMARLRDWVDAGGTLIAIASGAEFLADSTSRFSRAMLRSQALADFPPPAFGLGEEAIRPLERMQSQGLGQGGEATETRDSQLWTGRAPALEIPGRGSPVLGPGLWALLGDAGREARKRGSLLAPEQKGKEKPGNGNGGQASQAEKLRLRQKHDDRLRRFLPSGAILRVDLDPEHWLNYGAGERVPVLTGRGDGLLAIDPVTSAGRYAGPGSLHLGGLLWPEAVGRISQTAYLTREAKGRGQMILFAGDPNFRGYFKGTQRLFLNAVILGSGLGARHTTPW